MQFLVTLRMRSDSKPDAVREQLRGEVGTAWTMLTEGHLRNIWQLPSATGGHGPAGAVVLLECFDEETARAQVGRFPFVQQGLVEVECMTLEPFLGFEVLFQGN